MTFIILSCYIRRWSTSCCSITTTYPKNNPPMWGKNFPPHYRDPPIVEDSDDEVDITGSGAMNMDKELAQVRAPAP